MAKKRWEQMSSSNTNNILEIKGISVSFDGFYALTDVTVDVKKGSIHFFIGPNGAGKTTLLDIICAKTKPTQGNVIFYPENREPIRLTKKKEHEIVTSGVSRKFQVPSVFVNLTVFENMMLSLSGNKKVFQSIFYKMSKNEHEFILSILERVDLQDRIKARAGALSHGEKQWLEIAMQLASKPEIIMLDEPAAGMGKPETFKTSEILKEIKNECTVIVIEHDMEFVKKTADIVTVLHEGKVLTEGSYDSVLANELVQSVYLGRG